MGIVGFVQEAIKGCKGELVDVVSAVRVFFVVERG